MTISYRKAVPGDIPAIVALGIEALRRDAYESLVISPEGIEETARACIASAQHFAWVAEKDGRVQGALVAMTQPLVLYERSYANVLMWDCTRVPGAGVALMREFVRWVKGRPAIKLVQYTGERNADPRVAKLVQRLGFGEQLPLYVLLK